MAASLQPAVFLSYASQDAEIARRICDALGAAGIDVWFDQSELRGGDVWDQKIKKQIRECALFLPIISANTNARAEGYFRLEWKLAVDRSHLMADDAPFLVPALISDMPDTAARVPDRFRDVQWTRLLTPDAPPMFAARVRALLTGATEPPRTAPSVDATKPPASAGSVARSNAPVDPATRLAWRPVAEATVPGTQWVLEKKLGEGGFGEAWLGLHRTMKERRVFKFCFLEERVRSLKRELTLFRVLKERVGGHANIVRLLDVHFSEPPFYVEMDYVDGNDLKSWCEQQGGVEKIPLPARLEIVAQIADALHAAHTAGVIHRDVKPGNILIAKPAGPGAQAMAKLSDFGIGQVLSEDALSGVTKSGFTQSIVIDSSSARSGTQLYMAPELAAGEPASVRTDLYSLGVVFYQLVIGDLRRPLTTDWSRLVEDPMLREDLTRCFASRAEERFATAELLAQSLRAYPQRRDAHAKAQAVAAAQERAARRWQAVRTVAIAAVVIGLGASLLWFFQRNTKQRWARETALPEIKRLVDTDDIPGAFALAIEAEKYLPADPALTSLWPRIAAKTSIETTPAGAEVYIKEYRKPDAPWRLLGKAPLKDVRLAQVYYRWQYRMDGYDTVERASLAVPALKQTLSGVGAIPAGMLRVPSRGTGTSSGLPTVQVNAFLIDRHEVTNRQFKAFVDQGGYAKSEFWKQAFVQGGHTLSWTEAMTLFRDTTDKPGPATWKEGSYAADAAEHPVTGVSWFEAAAYAEFAGKRLPSIYHWMVSALVDKYESIVPFSNYSGGKGLSRVGSHQGVSSIGTYDMAGNAKEWCWNEAQPGNRYILGGAVGEPDYTYTMRNAASAFERSALNGFRCIQLHSDDILAPEVDAPLIQSMRSYATEKPVSDDAFQLMRSLYSYDKTKLDARVEATSDTDPTWRKEKVSFNTAYGNERMSALLFLPKQATGPYQTVIYFPGSGAQTNRSSDELRDGEYIDYIVRSGRALVYPVYKGTYERGFDLESTGPQPRRASVAFRDWTIQLSKDLGRTVDYLESRPDIQTAKLAYLGLSWGAALGAVLPALESRLKVNVLVIGGFPASKALPEADAVNFAPRITTPTLMLNGRFDFTFPLETLQRPMFQMLGTPPEHKRHVLFDTGHGLPAGMIAKDVLDWLDKYLGPVR